MNKIAAIQMASGSNVSANLIEVEREIRKASEAGAGLIVLPENFSMMGHVDADQIEVAEEEGDSPVQHFLSEQAKKYNVWLIAGTIPIKSSNEKKVYAACLIYNNQGQFIKRYNKIHLFDVYLESHGETYIESETFEAGEEVVVVETPFGKVGLAICYDLRFPELFRKLVQMGSEIIVVPSAFTAVTGKAHWEVLLRARAIENLCYIVAPNQGGYHVNGRETYGHSMIVDPWGGILDILPQGAGYVIADIDIGNVKKLRKNFPVLGHRKIPCTLPNES